MLIDPSSTRVAPSPKFMRALREAFDERVQFGEAVRRLHGGSESHFGVQLPDAVVFARGTEDVRTLATLCSDYEVPLVAFGAGTSMEGHTLPVRGGVSLNLAEMNAILEVNEYDLDCRVQPGVRREQLNEHLRAKGLFFPIDPGANATIGGMAATRASGTNAVRYGTMREAALSLQVVTADGRIVQTGSRARKSAAGYDLTRLFVGSEGTLGIITEITLRLHGIPECISSAVCPFATLSGAVDTVVEAIQLGVPLARVELLDDNQMRAANLRSGLGYAEQNTLFFEFHGSKRYVAEQIELIGEIAASNGGGSFRWAMLPEERSKLWKARHEAFYAAIGLRKGAVGWPTDVCVPISRLSECILETKRDLEASVLPATIVGHVGDGNFHVIFVLDPNASSDFAEAERLNRRLIERALSLGGTCTGEHGIGLGKREWLAVELGESVEVMRSIKRAIDPKNILNPGKIFL